MKRVNQHKTGSVKTSTTSTAAAYKKQVGEEEGDEDRNEEGRAATTRRITHQQVETLMGVFTTIRIQQRNAIERKSVIESLSARLQLYPKQVRYQLRHYINRLELRSTVGNQLSEHTIQILNNNDWMVEAVKTVLGKMSLIVKLHHLPVMPSKLQAFFYRSALQCLRHQRGSSFAIEEKDKYTVTDLLHCASIGLVMKHLINRYHVIWKKLAAAPTGDHPQTSSSSSVPAQKFGNKATALATSFAKSSSEIIQELAAQLMLNRIHFTSDDNQQEDASVYSEFKSCKLIQDLVVNIANDSKKKTNLFDFSNILPEKRLLLLPYYVQSILIDNNLDPFLRLLFSFFEIQVFNCYISSLGIQGFLKDHATTSARKAEWKATLAANPTISHHLNIQLLNDNNFGGPLYVPPFAGEEEMDDVDDDDNDVADDKENALLRDDDQLLQQDQPVIDSIQLSLQDSFRAEVRYYRCGAAFHASLNRLINYPVDSMKSKILMSLKKSSVKPPKISDMPLPDYMRLNNRRNEGKLCYSPISIFQLLSELEYILIPIVENMNFVASIRKSLYKFLYDSLRVEGYFEVLHETLIKILATDASLTAALDFIDLQTETDEIIWDLVDTFWKYYVDTMTKELSDLLSRIADKDVTLSSVRKLPFRIGVLTGTVPDKKVE